MKRKRLCARNVHEFLIGKLESLVENPPLNCNRKGMDANRDDLG